MKINKNVQSNICPQFESKSTFVRVPKNIKVETKVFGEIEETIYIYDEEIYDKDEYIEKINENEEMNNKIIVDLLIQGL